MRKAYAILAPGWTHTSSGPRALHLLCHHLNECGEKAYIIPQNPDGFSLNPYLNTQILKPEYANFFGQNIIAVYPDVVKGNPLNARHVCRWLLAPRGLYGGDSQFHDTDKIWGFRTDLAEKVLCLPTFDFQLFKDIGSERRGTCYYAHKYDKIHGNTLPDIVKDSIRLEGEPEYIASVLQRSEKMYLLEPSEIKIHAILSGCLVEEIISPYFFGMGDQPDFMREGQVKPYHEMMSTFHQQLKLFIEDTQAW